MSNQEDTKKRAEAEKLFDEAVEHRDAREYTKAIEKLKQALVILEGIEDNINIGRTYNNLGALYQDQKKYEEAEEAYKKARDKGVIEAYNNLGNVYKDQKKYEEAEEAYNDAIKNKDFKAYNNLGALYQDQKKYEEAEEAYKKARDKGVIEAYNNLGTLYQDQKKYEEAEEAYNDAIKNKDFKAYYNLGLLYQEQKEYDEAEEAYNDAIKNKDFEAYYNLGVLYAEQKEYGKAEEAYKKARDKGFKQAYYNLGVLYAEQKEYGKAEEAYKKARDKGFKQAYNNLGLLYQEQKKYDEAEEAYKKAIENKDFKAYGNLGNLYAEQKKYDEAEEAYKKARDKGFKQAYNNLGFLYEMQEKYDEAEGAYKAAAEKGAIEAYNNLGILYAEQKKYDEAEEVYKRAIKKGVIEAYYALGTVQIALKKYEEAITNYKKYIGELDKEIPQEKEDIEIQKALFSQKEDLLNTIKDVEEIEKNKDTINIKLINHIDDFIDAVSKIESNKTLFRGMNRASWELEANLFRGNEAKNYKKLRGKYDNIKANFEIEAPSYDTHTPFNAYDEVDYISLIQHHGGKTPLLDWTEDITIALFFALYQGENKDVTNEGIPVVVALDYSEMHDGKMYSLTEINKALEEDKEPLPKDEIMIFKPKRIHTRANVQSSVFTYHRNADVLQSEENKGRLTYYIINPLVIDELRTYLDHTGRSEEKIYPDLEHLLKKLNCGNNTSYSSHQPNTNDSPYLPSIKDIWKQNIDTKKIKG